MPAADCGRTTEEAAADRTESGTCRNCGDWVSNHYVNDNNEPHTYCLSCLYDSIRYSARDSMVSLGTLMQTTNGGRPLTPGEEGLVRGVFFRLGALYRQPF